MPRISTEEKLAREIALAAQEEERLRARLADTRKKLADARKAQRVRDNAQRRKTDNHIKFTIGGELFGLGVTMEQAATIRRLAEDQGGVEWLMATLERAAKARTAMSPQAPFERAGWVAPRAYGEGEGSLS